MSNSSLPVMVMTRVKYLLHKLNDLRQLTIEYHLKCECLRAYATRNEVFNERKNI